MQFLQKLIGLALIIVGIYFLGQNIFFSTQAYPFFWRGIAAHTSILLLMGGVLCLLFIRGEGKNIGWMMIAAGAVFVFLSGQAVLRPTSLWQFLISFAAFASGYKLLNTRSRFL